MNKSNWIEDARNLLIGKTLEEIITFTNYIELERNIKHVIISYGLLFAAQKEGIFDYIDKLITAEEHYSPKELEEQILPKLINFLSSNIR